MRLNVVIGAAVVIGSSLTILHRERVRAREAAKKAAVAAGLADRERGAAERPE